jgi:hypothetical protein
VLDERPTPTVPRTVSDITFDGLVQPLKCVLVETVGRIERSRGRLARSVCGNFCP